MNPREFESQKQLEISLTAAAVYHSHSLKHEEAIQITDWACCVRNQTGHLQRCRKTKGEAKSREQSTYLQNLLSSPGIRRELKPWETITVGGVSGGLAAVTTTPFDVIKTRMMTAEPGEGRVPGACGCRGV
jgi:hypothetical protein